MKIKSILTILWWCTTATAYTQEINITHESYGLSVPQDISVTSVKDQGSTGTCWSFSTTSFIESEALRKNKGEHDLSEMYFVRQVYPHKADNYVRRHGNATFGDGGLSHDIMAAVAAYGMLPESVYSGLQAGSTRHHHGELHNLLLSLVKGVVDNKEGNINPQWKDACNAILDSYLGEIPKEFQYNGLKLDPLSYSQEVLGFNPYDYAEFTSFTHHPYYKKLILEIPDNWANASYYNLPLDEFQGLLDHALDQGYTVVWDGDVSEKEFSQKHGIAIVPQKSWEEKSTQERAQSFAAYEPEKVVTEKMRQEGFDSYATTDDHLMHIVGKVKDQRGITYYLTKNSWGSSNKFGGYLFMSEAYVQLKTIAFMVHKEAVPQGLAEKIEL